MVELEKKVFCISNSLKHEPRKAGVYFIQYVYCIFTGKKQDLVERLKAHYEMQGMHGKVTLKILYNT